MRLANRRVRACACLWECLKERAAWCVRWNPICLKIVCVPLTWFHSRREDDDVRFNAFRARWKRRRRRRRRGGRERSIDLTNVTVRPRPRRFSHGSTRSLSPNAGYKSAQVCHVISLRRALSRNFASIFVEWRTIRENLRNSRVID